MDFALSHHELSRDFTQSNPICRFDQSIQSHGGKPIWELA
jgi:hypothetical protein